MSETKEEKFIAMGLELSLIGSLVNILETCISYKSDVKAVDIENLVIVIKNLLEMVNSKYDTLESMLNI